jgi:hypothetical protein
VDNIRNEGKNAGNNGHHAIYWPVGGLLLDIKNLLKEV